MANATQRKPGRPKGAARLDQVLYVRASEDLLDLLDRLVKKEREIHPGRSVSRADIARELLYNAAKERD